jgi:Electron transfer flavoprotein domain
VAAVLVHIDLDGDRPHASSLQALAAGRHVASSWGATLYAALIVHDPTDRSAPDSTARVVTATKVPGVESAQTTLARAGADKVIVALTDAAIAPLWSAVGNAWQGVLDHLRPRLVLFGADSPSAAELAPRTGARIGARLLLRARAIGVDDVELRDRDGGYVRVGDSGAAVAMIGRADPAARGEDDIDLVVLAVPGGSDPRVELVGSSPAEISHTAGAIVALGDDVANDTRVVADAQRLAKLLGAQLVGSAGAAKALATGAVIERSTPLAPELCVTIGGAQVDVSGATRLIKVGAPGGKLVDGALTGPAREGLAELAKRLGNL